MEVTRATDDEEPLPHGQQSHGEEREDGAALSLVRRLRAPSCYSRPMRMFACGTVLFALACGGGGAPATPTTPSSLPALSSPELTGCVVPGAGRLAALSVGEQLANDGRGVDHAAPADLTVLAPELAARGARIALATPAQLDDDAMAELLVIAEPQRAVNTIDARTFELHFYDCTQHGLRPLGPPVERFADAVTVEVQSGELVTRGDVVARKAELLRALDQAR